MVSQHEYLRRTGVLDTGDTELINQHKSEYRKAYKRAKNKQYRSARKRTELYLSPEEHAFLKKKAKEYRMKLGQFIRHSSLAYLRQVYLVPDDNAIHDMAVNIKRIGNNVNQLAHLANARGDVRQEEILACHTWINELVDLTFQRLSTPQSLNAFFQERTSHDPEFPAKALEALRPFLSNEQK